MRKRFLSVVFALGIVGGVALPAMAESRLLPAMGISQTDADGLYGSLAGEAGWGGTQDHSLATLIAKAATADGHVVNRLFGDGRYAQLAAANTFTSGTFTFTNPLTINLNAATTIDATGFVVTLLGSSWDYRGAANVFVPDATFGEHAMNRQTGDVRWGQLAAANTFTQANTFDGDVTLGDAVGDAVTYNAGTHTYSNPSTINYNGDVLFDGSGFTMNMRAAFWDFRTTTGGVEVPNPTCSTCALNSQTGDARYFAKASSLKSGTVAGASFAGNPKIFTVTFGATFPDTNYSVSVISEEGRTWTFQSKLAGSFVMNSNANLALTLNVDWTAIAHNDP